MPINVIKAKIEELKRTNNTPPVTFIKKLKEYLKANGVEVRL